MKEILFVHPFGQAFALVFGLFNIITGFTKKWFNIPIHLNCGLIYYLVSMFGAGIGMAFTKWAHRQNLVLETDLHRLKAMVLMFLLATGATSGFLLLRNSVGPRRLVKLHGIVNLAGIVLFGMQVASGVMMLLRLF